ncbi:TonB-dependent receptor domain-containing protein [Microbulbifer sp. 2205BS26-8]|uniref:TonB-dependent receptor family protein n=1 Tax=Microbulbifer sp. 2205BS26-8 TaxID=3064386 RepID=UPI00273F4D95|nr:TonB-dependent receptor [Microbulbifer sp. 2205BS26-8]MDP5209856.1 TonB-dependent receptor [Microbulbifer sp. 2205BS26-8]
MTLFPRSPLAFALAALTAMPSLAEERLETVSVIGDPESISSLPGSAHLIDTDELAKFEFVDINRILRSVPGVYLLEEDGYGLRPNIGIRGAQGGRSGKISLMEDGVLIAPAPYSAPEAYYFPSAGRLDAIEVLKGPAALLYGPFTVGGAVNMLSTPIPESPVGMVQLEAGEYGEARLHSYYGTSTENTGWLLETQQQYADGFRSIDRAGSADIAKEDYLLKGHLRSDADATYRQQLDIKLQYSEEESGMSYLGLSDADLNDGPNRRYGISALDEMQNRHSTVQLNHSIQLDEDFTLHTQAYYNKFKRDWFKVGLGDLIEEANSDDETVAASAQAILNGQQDYLGFGIKHNNREYESKGIQVSADWLFDTGSINHELTLGLRRHWDEVDRYQPVEIYDQINGQLVFDRVELPSPSNNRIEEADATSFFISDDIQLGNKLTLTAVLRYEDLETQQQRYNDAQRTEKGSYRSNQVDEWLPGLGLVYQVSEQWGLLAGVHRGFAPPGAGAKNGQGPELSTNYEWGARFDNGTLAAELIAFYSDYENAVQNCSVAVSCPNGAESGTFQLGEAEIKGLEAALGSEWVLANGWTLPVRATYTYTDAEVTEDQDSLCNGDPLCDVNPEELLLAGDNLVYLPENVFAVSAGLDSGAAWRLNLTAAYQDEMCVNTRCNRGGANQFDYTESLWVVDAAAHYDFSADLTGYLKVDNLFDEQVIISRSPEGARANRPRAATVGIKYIF